MKKHIINYQKIWKTKPVDIQNLLLDSKNIRLDFENMSQDEIINDLFINENAIQILQNIVDNGYFPDELPVVIKEEKKYVVLEGNRRVVSLKAMINPNIAPHKYVTKINFLMNDRNPLRKIDVCISPSREAAEKYLAAKHTKNTRRPWSTLRRAYFYYAQKENGQKVAKLIERYKDVDIPKYIKMYEMHHIAMSLENITDSVRKNISNKRTFDITTLERFYSDEYIRDWMNIEFDPITGEVKVPKTNSFDKVYSRILSDIVNKRATSRRNLSSKESRKIYIDSVIKEILDGRKMPKKNISKADIFKEKSSKISVKKKKFISSKIENTFDSHGIDEVLRELKNIDYYEFPNATVDMLRTFLEIVLRKFLKEKSEMPSSGRNGFVTFEAILAKSKHVLTTEGHNDIAQIVRVLMDDKWYLDAINHNPDIFADYKDAEKWWHKMEPVIKHIFNEFKVN
mgnify:CR=1 FL=1